jgi:hypothetical protein
MEKLSNGKQENDRYLGRLSMRGVLERATAHGGELRLLEGYYRNPATWRKA